MCGIYGITDHNPEFIHQYIQTCKHRGPDGEKVWWDPDLKVTLGHNLLSIMSDPKLSIQPWKTPNGNVLIYNGEIFNYYELKDKYKSKGFAGLTGTDTDLLAWGLDTYGLKFLDEIDSMHGFAYYKIKEQEIWISRDHAGIKPLFYAEVKEGLVFGSEIKGMLDKVPGSRKIDNLAVSFMGKTGINALRNTFFTGIKKLLAGETIVYDVANKRIKKSYRQHIVPVSKNQFNVDEFRDISKTTVKMCSIGRRKIGVFLSGGLDSSLVAYELNKLKGEANTFTNRMYPNVTADEDYNSDAKCAEILAKQNNFNHTEVKITPENFIESWQDSIYYMEQPVYNPSMAMYCYTNKFLSNKGIVVTMAGDMGDEVLAGYPKYWKMKNPEWLKKQIGKSQITSWEDVLKLWLKRIKRPLQLTSSPLDENILLEEFKKCYSEDLWNPHDPIGSHMALDCVAQVPEEMFNRNDKYGMAYSMEGRFPLATKKFMKYAMGMHTEIKMGNNKSNTKILTKQAYQGILPHEIINKDKTGWTVPVGHWLTSNMSENLKTFYNKSMKEKSGLDMIKASQKAGKALVPAWIVNDWIKKYEMYF
jgi:asparagine synthase (glutamine-hydrolysing)